MASRITLLCFLLTIASSYSCTKEGDCIERGINFTHLSSPEVVVEKNAPLLLNCSVAALPELGPFNISWRHEGFPLPTGRYHIFANGSLMLDHVVYQKKKNGQRDDGNYTCLVSSKAGIMFSRPIAVKVARMWKAFSVQPKSSNVPIGGVARLTCSINGVPAPQYSWQLNREDIPAKEPRFVQLTSGVLQIINVSSADAGNYRCIAKNVAKTQASNEATLTVHNIVSQEHAPQFLSSPSQELTPVVGETAEFECLIYSSSQPSISWRRDGGASLPTNRTTLTGQGNLRVARVEVNDSGSYECIANITHVTGEIVIVSQTHRLTVYEPPSFEEDLVSQAHPAARTTRFECSAKGHPPPEIRWYKNGRPLSINGRIKVLRPEDGKFVPQRPQTPLSDAHAQQKPHNVLVLSHIVTRDAGIYQCVAVNAAGTRTIAARLQLNTSGDQPGPPTNLKARPLSSTSMQLSWNASTTSSGQLIQAYSVHYLPTSGGNELQKVSVNTSYTIDKLKPFTSYTFYVRAYSGKSASEQSEAITQMTLEDIPLGAPSVTVTSLTPTTMHISWTEPPPPVARGIIVSYRIHYRLHDQNYNNVMEVKGNVLEYTITGLEPTKTYDVRVLGGTMKGFPVLSDDAWPWVTYMMPAGFSSSVPQPPMLYLSVVNATTLEARWVIPPEEKNIIAGFKLRYREQGDQLSDPIVLPNTTLSYRLCNLRPQTWYEVYVLSFVNDMEGQEAIQTILTRPENMTVDRDVDPPETLEAEPIGPRSIRLSWKPPESVRNITYYTIRYSAVHTNSFSNASAAQCVRSTSNEIIINNLLPFTLYGFAVRSHESDDHSGRFSQLIQCRTAEDKPTVPRDITWSPVDTGSIRVNWEAPEFSNGIIQSYHIYYNVSSTDSVDTKKWQTKEEPGTRLTSVLNGLSINTVYSLSMRAETQAGSSPLTQVIKFVISVPSRSTISPHPQGTINHGDNDPSFGILLGVLAGCICMTLCALIILYRNRKCGTNGTGGGQERSQANGSTCFASVVGHHKDVPATQRELELLSPQPTSSDDYLDTKGGYPGSHCNGKPNGHMDGKKSNGHLPNGHAGNGYIPRSVRITENPQRDEHVDLSTRLPLPREQVRYDASDKALCEDQWDQDGAPTPLLEANDLLSTAGETTLETVVTDDSPRSPHRPLMSTASRSSTHSSQHSLTASPTS
ncbi:protogenin-like [Ornithodoros turicata]|uniref:protogenin-like n=1 Tax=Ornithodoros turicata TaxID=34597 RepID=UPI00313A0673